MSLDGDHLLKRLQPVVRPCGPEFDPPPRAGSGDFTRLIQLAASGGLVSGRPVDAGGCPSLDDAQLAELSRGCDALEAEGIRDGAILLDGRAFLMTVPSRSVTREMGADDVGRVHALEGIVLIGALQEQGDAQEARSGGMQAIPAVPPGVMDQLDRASRATGQ